MIVSLATLEEILQAEDIEGLHALGAPGDEYHQEAAAIQVVLEGMPEDELTTERVGAELMNVWSQAFGPFSEADLHKRIPALQRLVHQVLEECFTSSGALGTRITPDAAAMLGRSVR